MTDLDALIKLAEEANARAEKATAGPWALWLVTSVKQETPSGERLQLVHGAAPPHEVMVVPRGKPNDWSRKACDDAAFVASARTDVPTLARAVIDLVARVKAAEAAQDRCNCPACNQRRKGLGI